MYSRYAEGFIEQAEGDKVRFAEGVIEQAEGDKVNISLLIK